MGCAWAGLHTGGAWTNATVAVEGKALLLSGSAANADATQYGYGAIPMMSVYDSQTGLPVLPWNMTLPAERRPSSSRRSRCRSREGLLDWRTASETSRTDYASYTYF